MNTLDVSVEHLRIVRTILRTYLPSSSNVWAFGSRVRKAKKKYSDLDLAIDYLNQSLPSEILTQLTEAFDESDLPYKVDLVDWKGISSSFKKQIKDDCILLNFQS